MHVDIKNILETLPIISKMVTSSQITHILNNLNDVLKENIKGDIVELGCNVGTTSLFIRKLLDNSCSTKKVFCLRFV